MLLFLSYLMDYVSNKDFLKVVSASLISDVDFDVIARLYQPLIGYKAAMLYFTLVNYITHNEGEYLSHGELFKLMQISSGDFLNARKALEASGLIKSYLKVEDDLKKYTYVIYSPKSPRDFFNDILFKGMLVKYIGEKEAIKLALFYENKIDLKDSKEISSTFVDVFQPDLDDDSFDSKMPSNLKDTKAIKVDTEFSFEEFFTHLKSALMINENAFSKDELNEIEKIATLYGVDIISMCDIVAQSFDENKKKGEKLDINSLKERAISQAKYSLIKKKNSSDKVYIKISGKTQLADELRLMEELSPKRYLQYKQDDAPAVTADLNLIYYLSDMMQLNRGVINALISYSLKMCNNRLNRNYVEKVAASLKREKILTAIDALNYLDKKVEKKVINKNVNKDTSVNKKKEEPFDEAAYNKLLESIKRRKNNG